MYTKLFHRLSYLLCLFQITCFAALQRIPLHSSSFSDCNDEHKKIDVVCDIHSEELQIEPKNFGNELLVYGYIREFEPKVTNKIIPSCIKNLCVDFSRRMLPCDCIKRKYRKILRKLDSDENRKKALIFCLMYKIEDVRDQKNKLRRTIFHCACKDGSLELAKLLRKWGANINAKDNTGRNALHLACEFSGSVEMATWLLDECKIDIESKGGFYQRTPFLRAVQEDKLEIAKLLRLRGANIHVVDKKGNNVLHFACLRLKSVSMTTWLLDECKIDIESKGGFYQRTPFLRAVQEGKLEIAKLLRLRGANIHVVDSKGNNVLHLACLRLKSVSMTTWLLDECKIDIESKGGFYQRTPFLHAVQEGKLEIAKLLRLRGANIHVVDSKGNNVLHLACLRLKSVSMTTWLLDECKIDIESKGEYQKTPFLCAVQEGKLDITKLLKERGANIHAKSESGYNALHLAKSYDRKEMISYLQSLGFT